eukprot:290594-Hanusia_phi.AAC.3
MSDKLELSLPDGSNPVSGAGSSMIKSILGIKMSVLELQEDKEETFVLPLVMPICVAPKLQRQDGQDVNREVGEKLEKDRRSREEKRQKTDEDKRSSRRLVGLGVGGPRTRDPVAGRPGGRESRRPHGPMVTVQLIKSGAGNSTEDRPA